MRAFRSTLILLVLAVGFGAYLYFVESKRVIEEEGAKKKVFTYDTSKIDQMQIKSASGEVTSLKKDATGWTIVSPAALPADQAAANDVVSNVASLQEDRSVDENATDLKPYGLAEPRMEVTFNVAGEKAPKRILLGDKSPTGVGVYAKLLDDSRVFLVGNAAEGAFNRSTFNLRDKTALKFQQENVQSLELVSQAQTIRLEKTGSDWKLVKPIQAPADYVSVQGLLGQLQSAQMTTLKDKPEETKDLTAFGLDKPEVVATIGMGAEQVVFQLGSDAEAGSVWGRDPSKPIVFTVASGLAEELRKTPFQLRKKDIFDFRPFNTTRFEITRGQETRAFERVKGTGENATDTWKQVTPATKTVDASNLEGALLEFSNLRADAAVDKASSATGSGTPAAVVTVKFEDGKREERVTIGRVGADVFATRSDQIGALKIEMGKYDEAVKKLDAVQ